VAQRRLQLEVERVARLLVPEQVVPRERLRVGDRGVEVEAAVGIDAEPLAIAQHAEDRVDPAQVLVERCAADLLLDDGVAAVEVALHLVLELAVVLARVVVAAGGVDEHAAIRLAVAVAVGEQLEQRLAFDLGDGVPDRHVDRADRHRALAVAAGFSLVNIVLPDPVRIEVRSALVDERLRRGLEHARDEPLAHQRALAVAAVRVEAVAHDALAVADTSVTTATRLSVILLKSM
jgi:hypothetical protein